MPRIVTAAKATHNYVAYIKQQQIINARGKPAAA